MDAWAMRPLRGSRMNPITSSERSFLILSPLALGITAYLWWCLVKGRIHVRRITFIRKKSPFGFWWDFTLLSLFNVVLWLVVVRGFLALLIR